jgi:hypothetical protein
MIGTKTGHGEKTMRDRTVGRVGDSNWFISCSQAQAHGLWAYDPVAVSFRAYYLWLDAVRFCTLRLKLWQIMNSYFDVSSFLNLFEVIDQCSGHGGVGNLGCRYSLFSTAGL